MPLRDHFHPPLSVERHWESFHAAWIGAIADALNRTLPKRYFAEEQVHAGPSIEIDVATFGQDAMVNHDSANGVAVAAQPTVTAPTATVATVFADDFEVKVITTQGGGPRVVAALEMISPRNKDRPEARLAFATKCASYLHHGIAVIVVDIVTNRTANLFNETLGRLVGADAARLPANVSLYAAALRPIRRGEREEIDLWPQRLTLGAALPTLPLWLTAIEQVSVDLEATYTDACERRRIA